MQLTRRTFVSRLLASSVAFRLGALSPVFSALDPTTTTEPAIVLWGARCLGGAQRGSPDHGLTAAAEMKRIERLLGRRFGAERFYWQLGQTWPSQVSKDSVALGRIPVISFGPSEFTWAQIADGQADAKLRANYRALQSAGGRFSEAILGFQNEPESKTWEKGTSADYCAAFRHCVEVARSEGLINKWTTFLMEYTWRVRNPDDWWPGDDVCDYVGVQGYGSPAPTARRRDCIDNVRSWRSFRSVFEEPHAFAVARGKPMLLGEWGQREDRLTPNPERKAHWFKAARVAMKELPAIAVACYYHSDGRGPCAYPDTWWIDSSRQAAAAFAAIGHDPYFGGAPTG
jgi:hypothetical protein